MVNRIINKGLGTQPKDDRNEELIAEYSSGKVSVKELCKKYGISQTRISILRKKYGIQSNRELNLAKRIMDLKSQIRFVNDDLSLKQPIKAKKIHKLFVKLNRLEKQN